MTVPRREGVFCLVFLLSTSRAIEWCGDTCGRPAGFGVYFGNGCFWHTQYDMYEAELEPPFNRSTRTATARTGYAGSIGHGYHGQVCYQLPSPVTPSGTYYGEPKHGGLGYAEAVQVVLDADLQLATAEFTALVEKYFQAYAVTDGVWHRQDPQDGGQDYRSVIGIPCGINSPLFAIVQQHNVHNFTLLEGQGGLVSDTSGEGVVYIYDTERFPFYRAEQYHQYHTNDVLGRTLPDAYSIDAKNAAINRGWINMTCKEDRTAPSNVEGMTSEPPFEVGGVLVTGDPTIMATKQFGSCPHAITYLRWGCDIDIANHIACHNTNLAEYSGYWLDTSFIADQQHATTTTFYDSVTGKPLFVAPIGRTWDEFVAESTRHGWPSFRDAEVVWKNVRVLDGGETVSVDGTHLGHNIPEAATPDVPRYCIDLVSVAGWKAKPDCAGAVLTLAPTIAPSVVPTSQPTPSLPGVAHTAVYFGDGCFWHTQYDFYTVELAAPFNRTNGEITARTGYGGSQGSENNGQVCYAHGPPPEREPSPEGTYYGYPGGLGYAEAVQVLLDNADDATRTAQFTTLTKKFFEAYILNNGDWIRQDPQDAGQDYRNVIGIPGGVNSRLFALVQQHNVHNFTLVEGKGGLVSDTKGEGVVYVYDSSHFPFYRAEQYHQYHSNAVLGRTLPDVYSIDAKNAAINRGWINKTCAEDSASGSNIETFVSYKVGGSLMVGTESIMSQKAYGTCAHAVQSNLRWGCDIDTANSIACHTRRSAERSGYWLGTSFIADQQHATTTTFYDSVTGKPLFVAPIGRTWDEFVAESTQHGWPSFRSAEVVWENVRVLDGGETVSVDGTHLGHNIPEAATPDVPRFCIDLVSVSGREFPHSITTTTRTSRTTTTTTTTATTRRVKEQETAAVSPVLFPVLGAGVGVLVLSFVGVAFVRRKEKGKPVYSQLATTVNAGFDPEVLEEDC